MVAMKRGFLGVFLENKAPNPTPFRVAGARILGTAFKSKFSLGNVWKRAFAEFYWGKTWKYWKGIVLTENYMHKFPLLIN
jgi:hypothetical protein